MQRDLEILMQNIHDAYCAHTECDRDAAFFWLRSFVTLVGTAQFVIDCQETLTLETLLQRCSDQQHDTLYFRAEPSTVITRQHCTEWILKAGEIRLLLHGEWHGDWDGLNIMEACRLYENALREANSPIVLCMRCI